MKKLILLLVVGFVSSIATAEFTGYQNSEEEIELIAANKLYPGGIDEDDLTVMEDIQGIRPFVTTEALLWKARRSAMGTSPESERSGNSQ